MCGVSLFKSHNDPEGFAKVEKAPYTAAADRFESSITLKWIALRSNAFLEIDKTYYVPIPYHG